MQRLFEYWRYYSFSRIQYHECMGNLFTNNLSSLRQSSNVVAIFICVFLFYPVILLKSIIVTGVFLAVALFMMLLSFYTNYKMQVERLRHRQIYVLILLFYGVLIILGMYLSVWVTPDKSAAVFLCLLICSLLMFVVPSVFQLLLTLCAMAVFVVFTVIVKTPDLYVFDIVNASIACLLSLYLNWQISKLRLGLELSTSMLEEERNKYHDQSILDELTQLKNRRDFMNTFQRYLSSYRTSDDWLCIAICDIDFFKNYNDYYGHPKGDDCLRAVGKVLNTITEKMGVYTARVGGEEFSLLWFEKDTSHVNIIVSTIMDMIKKQKIIHERSTACECVTMSIGIYIERLGESNDAKTLYALADKALYTAKGSGRNCAIVTGREIEQYKITPLP